MGSLKDEFSEIRRVLISHYGRSGVASADATPHDHFDRLVSVFLARSVPAAKLDRLVDALRDAGLLDELALAEADVAELEQVAADFGKIRSQVFATLGRLARWVVDRGGAEALADLPTESLREELRELNGVGPATAEAILLHALDRPAYPIDRPTYRIFVRHGWLDISAGFDEAREAVEGLAPDAPDVLADLAHALDRVGAQYCKPATPRCERCPLRPWLPENGPYLPLDE